jgi:hypothetical protein
MLPLPAPRAETSFRRGIAHVVQVGSQEEVGGVATSGLEAVVAHMKIARIPVFDRPRHSMRPQIDAPLPRSNYAISA